MDYLLSLVVVALSVANGFAVMHLSGITFNFKNYKAFNFGSAFFIGVLFLIVSVKLFSFIFGNSIAGLGIFCFISLVIIFFARHHIFDIIKNHLTIKTFFIFISFFLLTFILLLTYWLQSDDLNNPFAMIGSLHSVRYAELAQYILTHNYIPSVGQNSGQSTLTYVVLAFGVKSPYIALTTFLVASEIFLSLFIYNLFDMYLKNKKNSIIATFLFFTANTALSSAHILIIDSGSPFFVNGYSDTLLGMFIIFMLVILYDIFSKLDRLNFKQYSLILFLFVGTFFVAPQNILLILGALVALSLLAFFKMTSPMKLKKTMLSLILISFVIAIPQGGMLTPSVLQDNVKIPGMMKVASNQPTIRIHPGIMNFIQQIDTFDPNNHRDRAHKIKELVEQKNLRSAIFYLEESFISSLRMVFFPFLGFIILFFFAGQMKEKYGRDTQLINIDLLKTIGITIFIIGFILVFSIDIHGYKWEMARFLIPGITLGLFSFILAVFFLLQKSSKFINLKIAIILILMSLSTLSEFVMTIKQRIVENRDSKTLENRYKSFSQSDNIVKNQSNK